MKVGSFAFDADIRKVDPHLLHSYNKRKEVLILTREKSSISINLTWSIKFSY